LENIDENIYLNEDLKSEGDNKKKIDIEGILRK
jgi:hypothetical protein